MIRGTCLTAVAVALTWFLIPTANADESGFLDAMDEVGVTTVLTTEDALMRGQSTCAGVRNGLPVSAILVTNNPGPLPPDQKMTPAQNWALFTAAVSELCPELRSGY
jgi:hypothetical protein